MLIERLTPSSRKVRDAEFCGSGDGVTRNFKLPHRRTMSLTIFFAAAFAADWSCSGSVETRWSINASIKYDDMWLTGIVTNDPYQTQFYPLQSDALVRMLPSATVAAGARVYRACKDAGVLTPWIPSLPFSSNGASGPYRIIAAALSPAETRTRLEVSLRWDAAHQDIYEHIRFDISGYRRSLKNEDVEN